MGSGQSSIQELAENTFLKKFSNDIPINRDEEFWEEFLSFKFVTPSNREESQQMKEAIQPLCSTLGANNKTTGNFTTLVCLCIYYIREIVTNKEQLDQQGNIFEKCQNALLVVRCCSEYFVEHYSEDVCVAQFNTLPTYEGQPTMLEEFLLVLTEMIVYIDVDESTYFAHVEAVTSLLVLLGSQMFDLKSSSKSKMFTLVMKSKCSSNAVEVTRKLLHNYIKNENAPEPKTVIGWAASGLWSFLGGISVKHKTPSVSPDGLHPLASHSLLLLLVLSFHYTKDENPYRKALFHCKYGRRKEGEEADTTQSFPLNFKRLYAALARDLQHDQSVLLLYLLLHKNQSFLKFTLRQKDLQSVVIPILQVLYNADKKNAHHIYMALIVVLMLTQEEEFNAVIHDMPVVDSEWFTEKRLHTISLGSLLVIIILRTIQFNMSKMRDKYLHTNCLASLANMSNNFKDLHSNATQKFITLFQQLIKRHAKLLDKTKASKSEAETEKEEELSDLAVLEEIIHMMIEILNACLCNNIKGNANIIYALLRDKELFVNFKSNPRFRDVVENIHTILTYFGSRVDEQMSGVDTSEGVIQIIEKATEDWDIKEKVKKIPHLKFKYMEEDAAEEFFVPYIWSIIYKSSFLYWDTEKIILFHAT